VWYDIILNWDKPKVGLLGRSVPHRPICLKSIYESAYRTLLDLLVEARDEAGMTQQQLADKLERPQSFVSKIEHGDRRMDIIEFLLICRLLRCDAYEILKKVDGQLKRR
jgi:DNA-binding XRE family transcriptional regulator